MFGFIAIIFLICVTSAQPAAVSRDIPRNSAAGEVRGGGGERSGEEGRKRRGEEEREGRGEEEREGRGEEEREGRGEEERGGIGKW